MSYYKLQKSLSLFLFQGSFKLGGGLISDELIEKFSERMGVGYLFDELYAA